MSFLDRFLKRVTLAPRHADALAAYRALPEPSGSALPGAIRIAVTDVETSGLDPHRDRLISIGAVGVAAGLVRFEDSFHAVVRQASPSAAANILIHGIDGTTQLEGMDPADALVAWLRFTGKAPLVGFHADFDRIVLTRAARATLGIAPANDWLDLAFIMPALFQDRGTTLDDWMHFFGVEAYARHDALSDALATAQLLQIALAEAARRGLTTLRDFRCLEDDQRRLARALRD